MNIYYTTLPLTMYVTHYLVPCGPGQDLAFLMYHFQIYSQLSAIITYYLVSASPESDEDMDVN